MTPGALTALQLSIKKWEAIVAGTGMDEGTNNCALCRAFINCDDGKPQSVENKQWDCFGCPVSDVTKQTMCDGSPYELWAAHQQIHEKKFPSSVFDDRSQELAEAELAFLQGLLPGDEA